MDSNRKIHKNKTNLGVSKHWTGFSGPLECGTRTWVWIIELECGIGIWNQKSIVDSELCQRIKHLPIKVARTADQVRQGVLIIMS